MQVSWGVTLWMHKRPWPIHLASSSLCLKYSGACRVHQLCFTSGTRKQSILKGAFHSSIQQKMHQKKKVDVERYRSGRTHVLFSPVMPADRSSVSLSHTPIGPVCQRLSGASDWLVCSVAPPETVCSPLWGHHTIWTWNILQLKLICCLY